MDWRFSGALGVKEGIYGSDFFLKAHGLYNPFFVKNSGRLVLLELYVYCIKERGALEGTVLRCCNGKSSSNTWTIFGRCGE